MSTVQIFAEPSVCPFSPSQRVWTEQDFDRMNWHDCRLHGIGFVDDFNPHQHDLRLDIDYILKWCDGGTPESVRGFWISPATLTFDASEVHVQVPGAGGNWILGIERRAEESFGYFSGLFSSIPEGKSAFRQKVTSRFFAARRYLFQVQISVLRAANEARSALT